MTDTHIDDLLDDIDEVFGPNPIDDEELEEYIDNYHARQDEADLYFDAYDSYREGFDEGQAEVALDILLLLPEDHAQRLVKDLAVRLGWALSIVTEDDIVDAWEGIYVEPPSTEDLDELCEEGFWHVWVESEMKLAARDTLESMLAPDPGEDYDEDGTPVEAEAVLA